MKDYSIDTKWALSYTNIFMAKVDAKYKFQRTNDKSLLYLRSI